MIFSAIRGSLGFAGEQSGVPLLSRQMASVKPSGCQRSAPSTSCQAVEVSVCRAGVAEPCASCGGLFPSRNHPLVREMSPGVLDSAGTFGNPFTSNAFPGLARVSLGIPLQASVSACGEGMDQSPDLGRVGGRGSPRAAE
jgi:hypothetical protein